MTAPRWQLGQAVVVVYRYPRDPQGPTLETEFHDGVITALGPLVGTVTYRHDTGGDHTTDFVLATGAIQHAPMDCVAESREAFARAQQRDARLQQLRAALQRPAAIGPTVTVADVEAAARLLGVALDDTRTPPDTAVPTDAPRAQDEPPWM